MTFGKTLGLRALKRLPPYSESLFRFCRRYVDRYRGDNLLDWGNTGERVVLDCIAPDCHVVFDVGANDGAWAAEVVLRQPQVDIHCFEPGTAWGRLRSRKFGDRVSKNNLACGDFEGELELYLSDQSDLCSSYEDPAKRDRGKQRGSVRVPVTTIDAYCKKNGVKQIDLLKIDVEGHELKVLSGATKMLEEKAIRCIQFEYTRWALAARIFLRDIFALLVRYGFTLYKLYPNGIRKIPEYDYRLDVFQYSNYLAFLDEGQAERVPKDGPARML
jgi:FkbM family methyltransferase